MQAVCKYALAVIGEILLGGWNLMRFHILLVLAS